MLCAALLYVVVKMSVSPFYCNVIMTDVRKLSSLSEQSCSSEQQNY